jgi:hypothetical protein
LLIIVACLLAATLPDAALAPAQQAARAAPPQRRGAGFASKGKPYYFWNEPQPRGRVRVHID